MTSDATTQYPDFQGTPTFVIDGKMVPNTASWDLLEPKLKDALK
jgi:protein-disulfide isomerase